ncbi:hypothetical protein PQQ51_10070 [Paraburkholderia xenovorans]|uniref:hypothetical protein n=1 Tax=Paraburkholderia xenovorans TaxID=36873 RepID=UPI0038B825E6
MNITNPASYWGAGIKREAGNKEVAMGRSIRFSGKKPQCRTHAAIAGIAIYEIVHHRFDIRPVFASICACFDAFTRALTTRAFA